MKILHILLGDNVKKNLAAVLDLTNKIAPETENIVLTDKFLDLPSAEVKIVKLKRFGCIFNRNIFLRLLYREIPDIVHVHGSWCHTSADFMKLAHQRGFVTFFSPYGGLMMKEIKTNLWKEKIWKLLGYQLNALRIADYVIAGKSKEAEQLKTLGRNKVIKMADDNIVELYTKAKMRKVSREVTIKTLHVLHQQLHDLILSRPMTQVKLSEREQSQYNTFCKAQHLTEIVGSKYDVPHYNEKDAYEAIYKMIRKLKTDIAAKTATMNDVFQLMATIRNNDYDEDKLVTSLKREKIFDFTCRIMQIGDELCGLEKGFMPCLPLNDNKTVKLKLQLITFP